MDFLRISDSAASSRSERPHERRRSLPCFGGRTSGRGRRKRTGGWWTMPKVPERQNSVLEAMYWGLFDFFFFMSVLDWYFFPVLVFSSDSRIPRLDD